MASKNIESCFGIGFFHKTGTLHFGTEFQNDELNSFFTHKY